MKELNGVVSNESYHWPPDLLQLLIDTIPLLVRSKEDVVIFFRGCGVESRDLDPWRQKLATEPRAVNKYAIARNVLTLLNDRGDSALAVRRTTIQRVAEFEEFSTCWEGDRLKAKGRVAEVRELVSHKDMLTRIVHERDADRDELRRERRARLQLAEQRRQQRENLRRQLAELRHETNVRRRGLVLEKVLSDLFVLDGLLIREPFELRDPEGTSLEQVDGVIEFDGDQYLVEMKWWTEKVEVNAISRHLVRLMGRPGPRGLVISASGYTPGAIQACRDIFAQRLVVLVELREIQLVLEREHDMADWLRNKVRTVMLDKNPYPPPGLL